MAAPLNAPENSTFVDDTQQDDGLLSLYYVAKPLSLSTRHG